MSSNKIFLCLAVLSIAVGGCISAGKGSSARSQPNKDIWYKEPKSFQEYLHIKGQLLDTGRVFEVHADYEVQAEKMLDSVPIVEVDAEMAKRMIGDHFRVVESYIPFLARGLYYSKRTGRWRVYELGDKLQVAHFCLGRRQADMHRQALVLLLKKKPFEVYTFCSASQ